MFLELLLVVAILTAVVTWYLNRRQVAKATEDTKQVADSGEKKSRLSATNWFRREQTATDEAEETKQVADSGEKKSPLSASSWFRRGQKPTDEAQEPTGDTKEVADSGEKKSRLSATNWFRRGQTPTDEEQTPTDEGQEPTDEGQEPIDEGKEAKDEAQTPTVQEQPPTDEAPAEQVPPPIDDLAVPSEPFLAWVTSTDEIDPELQRWISTLSDEALKSLTKQLAMHCQNIGMELDWLLGKQLHISPSLQKTMPQLIIAYLTSRHKAAQVHDEAQAFKTYQDFDKKPDNHRDLARKLYAKLVEDGLVTISASDLLHDDRQKRQAYIVSTIRQTANSEPVAFNKALKATIGLSPPC